MRWFILNMFEKKHRQELTIIAFGFHWTCVRHADWCNNVYKESHLIARFARTKKHQHHKKEREKERKVKSTTAKREKSWHAIALRSENWPNSVVGRSNQMRKAQNKLVLKSWCAHLSTFDACDRCNNISYSFKYLSICIQTNGKRRKPK